MSKKLWIGLGIAAVAATVVTVAVVRELKKICREEAEKAAEPKAEEQNED